jgi:hypothetical protein
MVVGLARAAAVKMIDNEFDGRRRWLSVQIVPRPRWVPWAVQMAEEEPSSCSTCFSREEKRTVPIPR